jgi:hypothetical protein
MGGAQTFCGTEALVSVREASTKWKMIVSKLFGHLLSGRP